MKRPKQNLRRVRRSLRSLKRTTIRYANPRYHVTKMLEDLRATLHALRCRDLSGLDQENYARALRGRLFACFVVAGAFSSSGMLVSLWLQSVSHSPYIGVLSVYVANNVLCTIAYQIAWWISSKEFYKEGRNPLKTLSLVISDVWPVQWQGLKWAALAALITLPFNIVVLFVLKTFAPKVGDYIPAAVLVAVVDFVFVSGTFVRVMGDIFANHSLVLAKRYWTSKESESEDPEPSPPHPDERSQCPGPASISAA